MVGTLYAFSLPKDKSYVRASCCGALGVINESISESIYETASAGKKINLASLKGAAVFGITGNPLYEGTTKGISYRDSKVWSFLQGPLSWSLGYDWSGEWSGYTAVGRTFGGFGCGFCCMANIYNTLSGREASPLDFFDFAIEKTAYSEQGTGAIGWGHLKNTLKAAGLSCDVYYKPETYEAFKEQIDETKSAIVLVSSNADNSFWQDTPGHYVNIWNYNKADGTVMLCEPGDPWNNRSRISLEYVYKALKVTSKYQYLMVDGYDEASDGLLSEGIDDAWCRPDEI